MIRIIMLCIMFFSLLMGDEKKSKIDVFFFGSKNCGECLFIKKNILIPLQSKYPQLQIHDYDINEELGFKKLLQFENKFKIEDGYPIELFFSDTFLLSGEEIKNKAKFLIEQKIQSESHQFVIKDTLPVLSVDSLFQKKMDKIGFWAITGAGLADGINPCAIATIIFLISFLVRKNNSRRYITLVGSCFCLAVFLSYLLMGIGALQAILALKQYYYFSLTIRWIAIMLAIAIAFLSIGDAIRYAFTGKTADIKLKLPNKLKFLINKTISNYLKKQNILFSMCNAFIAGVFVTALEAVCTGQVYLPAIIMMTGKTGLKLQGWLYLIYYNLLFIAPLVGILIGAYFGLTWQKISYYTKKNITIIKLLMGMIMLFLAYTLYIQL